MSLHLQVPALPNMQEVSMVRGEYDYWHYMCDGVDDRGWGCGCRTLQTNISWCVHNIKGIRKEHFAFACLLKINNTFPADQSQHVLMLTVRKLYLAPKLFKTCLLRWKIKMTHLLAPENGLGVLRWP